MAAERLTSAMLAGALMRRAGTAGGFATVLVKGDPTSGVILVQAVEKGQEKGLFERVPDYEGGYRLVPAGPAPRPTPKRDPPMWTAAAAPIRTCGSSNSTSRKQNGSPLKRSADR